MPVAAVLLTSPGIINKTSFSYKKSCYAAFNARSSIFIPFNRTLMQMF
jgi:hypothetical protein